MSLNLKRLCAVNLVGLLLVTLFSNIVTTAEAAPLVPVNNECVNMVGNTTLFNGQRVDLDLGVIDVAPNFLDDRFKTCVKPQAFADAPMEIHGWGFNTNLGWISFRNEDTGNGFSNRGIASNSNIEYGATIYKEAKGFSIRGYIWGDNLGWVKMNCKADPNFNFDKDLCLDSNFGVTISDKKDLQGYHVLTGLAWSETFQRWINFQGVKVRLPLSKLNLNPVVTTISFSNALRPKRNNAPALANGREGYKLKLEFFSDRGENMTSDFHEAGLDFCFTFKDNRKLNLTDPDQVVANDCTSHPNQNWPLDLDSFNSEDFNFNNSHYLSSLMTSYVPAVNNFVLEEVIVSDGVYEQKHEVSKNIDFLPPIAFYVDTNTNIDNNLSLTDCMRNSNQMTSYDFEYGENEFLFCTKFDKGILRRFTADLSMDYNVINQPLNLDFYEAPFDPDNPVGLNVNSAVERVYVDIPDQNLPINTIDLHLTGTYRVAFPGGEYTRSVPNFGALNPEYGLNYLGLVKSRFESSSENLLQVASDSRLKKEIMQLTKARFNCKYSGRVFGVGDCESDFIDNVYLIENFDDRVRTVPVSMFESFLATNPEAVIVLRDLNLFINKNINFDQARGFVLLDSDKSDLQKTDILVKSDVTDINAHFYADGLLRTVLNTSDRLSDLESSHDASLYSQLTMIGSLRTDNCINCSQSSDKRLADGRVVTDANEDLLKLQDLHYVRRSPLYFKFIKMGPLSFYADCNSGVSSNIVVDPDSMDYSRSCVQDSLSGREILKSSLLEEGEYQFEVPYSTTLIYAVPPRDMPIFGVK